MKKEIKEEAKREMFKFLNALRKSGEVNMFGAGSYLIKQFSLSKKEARFILQEWMQNFDTLKNLK